MSGAVGLVRDSAENGRPVVASDLEGTLTAARTWEAMRDFLVAHGHGSDVRRLMARSAHRLFGYRLGFLDGAAFKERWILDLLRLFAGSSPETMQALAHFVVDSALWPQRRQVVVDELRRYRDQGHRVIILTGIFEPILAELLQRLDGFEGIGTPLHYRDGRFTGQIVGELTVGPRKVALLQPFAHNGRIVAAYGDTARDIPMLEMSHRPVAVYPDRRLADVARTRGWRIIDGAQTTAGA